MLIRITLTDAVHNWRETTQLGQRSFDVVVPDETAAAIESARQELPQDLPRERLEIQYELIGADGLPMTGGQPTAAVPSPNRQPTISAHPATCSHGFKLTSVCVECQDELAGRETTR